MTRPLYETGGAPSYRHPSGHAGLWFDKFCNQWNIQGSSWTLESGKDHDEGRSKLKWINTVTDSRIGAEASWVGELASRMVKLVDRRGGRFSVFTSESRFVTGLGRSHPIENGFVWHPTLGTPYLPGSSVKGAVRAWAKRDADPPTVKRLLGDAGVAGSLCFLDAVPIMPVQLESDVMTPHYAGWTEIDLPGDWRSPVPVPFLAAAPGTSLLFSIIPRGAVTDNDLKNVMSWLCSALAWSGSGAKTAVGYGRFRRDDARTNGLIQGLREQERKREERIQAARAATEREARRAAMDPIEREIEEILEERPNKNEPDFAAIIRMVQQDSRWSGSEQAQVARWLECRMKAAKKWKEKSKKKTPSRDKDFQRTLLVKGWLDEGQA